MPLDELVNKSEDNPWIDLCLVDSSHAHIKMVEFGPFKTLKIDPSLSPSGRGVVKHAERALGCFCLEL